MSDIPVVDHAEAGTSRLAAQYRNKPNFASIFKVLFRQCQDLEVALQQLLDLRSVDTAQGEQLSVLERIVGQPRLSTDDEVRRAYVRARVKVNKSSGTADELLTILALVLEPPRVAHLVEQFPAGIYVTVTGGTVSTEFASVYFGLLMEAKVAGVRLVFEYYQSADGAMFQFDEGPGFDQGFLAGAFGG